MTESRIMGVRPTRIAVLNSHPIQYFAPLYSYLNQAPDLQITALYLSDVSLRGGKDQGFGQAVKWDLDLLAGYQSVFVGRQARHREPSGFWSLVAPQIWSEVRSGRYDVLLLHGHHYAANLIALAAAKTAGLPVLMRGETHLGLQRNRLKSVIRRPLMGALYACCDRLLAIGSANTDFYKDMGVPEGKIFRVPYAIDNERFIKASNLTCAEKAETRIRYGIARDRPVILYSAKFTPRKRPLDLLKAARKLLAETRTPFSLVMAGSGELEPELRSFCLDHAMDNVIFTGFVNQTELPKLYAAADLFVLPSEDEPWGLAINEAMCARLPIVLSQEVGCAVDLVEDGINGSTFKSGDIDGLARALKRLIEDPALIKRQGQASFDRIVNWGFQECLEGIRQAVSGLSFKDRERNSQPARAAAGRV